MAQLKTTFAPSAIPAARTVVGEVSKCPPLGELKTRIASEVGISDLEVVDVAPSDPYFVVKPADLVKLLQFLRDDLNLEFNFLQVISVTDFVDVPKTEDYEGSSAHAELLYVLYSLSLRSYLNIKVNLDRNHPEVDSVAHLFRAANWYERECFDMVGVNFKGHPFLQRVLLPADWVGHPLRKDYVFPEEYNGMKVPL